VTTGSRDLAARVAEALPELRPRLDEVLTYWHDEEPGLHVLVGETLNPWLVAELAVPANDETLRRAFAFVEELATTDDALENVVCVTVCAQLGDDSALLERARPMMGERTLALSHEIERFWGRE
jgi:hypothetical protein